jgi:lipopolysaccharide export system protein LptA
LPPLLFALLLAVAPGALADSPEAGASSLRVGVAPFESVTPPGAAVPDVATLLADRIATRGVQRVVGPGQLGAVPDAEPEAAEVKAWASGAEVDAIAVGRTTRIGNQLSVDVRLRSGESGEVERTFVAEVLRPEQLEGTVDSLAGKIIAATLALVGGIDTPEEAAGDGASASEPSSAKKKRSSENNPFDVAAFDSNKPLSIHSDELEAFQNEGARRLVFSKRVHVKQDDMELTSHRLEAFYPANASQPDRLVASGSVKMMQGNREARCDRATYHRSQEMLICAGSAELRDGEDVVTGDVIEFDLASERVVVTGGASVLIHPEEEEQSENGPGGAP